MEAASTFVIHDVKLTGVKWVDQGKMGSVGWWKTLGTKTDESTITVSWTVVQAVLSRGNL